METMPIGIGTEGLFLSAAGTAQDGVRFIPCRSAAAIAAPAPVRSNGRNAKTNQLEIVAATGDAGRLAYIGYLWRPVAAGQAASVVRGALVTGFTGLTAQAAVYATDAASPSTGGLTHTVPATGENKARIGVAVSTDSVLFD